MITTDYSITWINYAGQQCRGRVPDEHLACELARDLVAVGRAQLAVVRQQGRQIAAYKAESLRRLVA